MRIENRFERLLARAINNYKSVLLLPSGTNGKRYELAYEYKVLFISWHQALYGVTSLADLDIPHSSDSNSCSVDSVLHLLQRLYSIMEQSNPSSKNGECMIHQSALQYKPNVCIWPLPVTCVCYHLKSV